MALVLHAEEGNKNACKSLIAAAYCGVKVDHVKEYQRGVSDKAHLFLKNSVFAIRNCVGKVPVLETPEGPIVESNAMARYVAKLNGDNNTLCGSSAFEFVQIEQWMSYATTDIDEILVRWVYIRTGVYPYSARAERRLIECMKRSLYLLNFHLAKKGNHLVGHRITLADIVMTCDLYLGFSSVLLKSLTSKFPHVERYFWNLVGQPNFKKFLGEVKQAESLPEIRPGGGLYVSPEVFEALIKKRTNQMMDLEEEEVNNQMMKAKKAKGVNNQMMDLEKEGVNNQMVEAKEGVNNQMDLEKEGVDQQFEAWKKELHQMTEEQRERVNQMVLNDDVASGDGPNIVEKRRGGVN